MYQQRDYRNNDNGIENTPTTTCSLYRFFCFFFGYKYSLLFRLIGSCTCIENRANTLNVDHTSDHDTNAGCRAWLMIILFITLHVLMYIILLCEHFIFKLQHLSQVRLYTPSDIVNLLLSSRLDKTSEYMRHFGAFSRIYCYICEPSITGSA